MGRRHRLGLIHRPLQRDRIPRGGQGYIAPAGNTDPYWANVVLLAVNDNAADASTVFDDQSTPNHTITTVGNAQYDTAQAPTGMTSSCLLDGTGDELDLDSSVDFAFGTGDFTIEGFSRFAALGFAFVLFDFRAFGVDGAQPVLYHVSNKINYYTNAGNRIFGTTVITTGVWYHWALARSGTNTKLFLNGTQEGPTYVDSTNYTVGAGGRPHFGAAAISVGNYMNGWMGPMRVTKGTARYTTTFTPPTLPLPTS